MTKEEIEELKQKISDGWAMAHDPVCSAGFEAADKYIKFLLERLEFYHTQKWLRNVAKDFK